MSTSVHRVGLWEALCPEICYFQLILGAMVEAEQQRREQEGAGEAMAPLDTLLTDTIDSIVPGTGLL